MSGQGCKGRLTLKSSRGTSLGQRHGLGLDPKAEVFRYNHQAAGCYPNPGIKNPFWQSVSGAPGRWGSRGRPTRETGGLWAHTLAQPGCSACGAAAAGLDQPFPSTAPEVLPRQFETNGGRAQVQPPGAPRPRGPARCSPARGPKAPGQGSPARPPAPSVGLALCELFLDGLFSRLAVREVEAKVGPLVRPRAPGRAPRLGMVMV